MSGGDLDLRHPSFEVHGVHWSRTGLEITRDLDYEEAADIAYVLSGTLDASRWGLADLLAHGERRSWRGRWSQLSAITARSPGGLMTMAWVGDMVPPEIRRRELSFSHHEAVAGLKIPGTEDEPDHEAMARWLEHAIALRLTRDELRAHIQASQANLSRARDPDATPPPIVEGTTTESASQVSSSPVPTPPSGIDIDRIIEAARAVIDSASEPKRDRSGRKRCWVDDDLLDELDRALGESS